MVCRHNTILALTTEGEVTHIVDTSTERNLVTLRTLDEHLAVPRYEPKTAKVWLKEPLELTYVNDYRPLHKKVLLSESDLRTLIKKETVESIEFYKTMLLLDTHKKGL